MQLPVFTSYYCKQSKLNAEWPANEARMSHVANLPGGGGG